MTIFALFYVNYENEYTGYTLTEEDAIAITAKNTKRQNNKDIVNSFVKEQKYIYDDALTDHEWKLIKNKPSFDASEKEIEEYKRIDAKKNRNFSKEPFTDDMVKDKIIEKFGQQAYDDYICNWCGLSELPTNYQKLEEHKG